MLIVIPSGLSKIVKKNLKASTYTQEEVNVMYHQILQDYAIKMVGVKRVIIIMIVIFIMLSVLSFSKMMESSKYIYILLFTGVAMIAVVFYVKYAMLDRLKRQFIKYAKLGGYNLNQ